MTGSQPQFIATKILPPKRVGLIERPRLLGLMAQVETRQLTVIKAPAGFGKTSLAIEWAERLRLSGNSVAWLTLDPDDDQPTRFLFYVAHALHRASESMGEAAIKLLLERSLIRPQAVASMLINDLADIDHDVFLFLDDYSWVADPTVQDAVSFFLKHAPSHFHLVLATRSEPPLSLAGLRAQNQLLEIDASFLRFDLDEIRHFLQRENLGPLDAADLHILQGKTEGWPAVLRIVAATFSQSGQEFAQYVRKLSGTLRPIGAYLAEMLDRLPHATVRFMMRTAILDRLCASLCHAVTGNISSWDLLESMAIRQLLVHPLDQEGIWYRYHPLLAEHLRDKLRAQLSEEIPELHRRAYRWYAAEEFWTDAIQHAIAAGDTDQAVNWIENTAMTLVKIGDLLTVLGWLRLFPELIRSQIKVRLAIAWGLALAMRFEEALRLLTEIEQDVDREAGTQVAALRCECQAIRSVAVALRDDSAAALSISETCLREATDPWTAHVASNVSRFGLWKSGDLASFYATPWIACSLEEERRGVFASVYRLCLHGLVETQQIRLFVAERCYLDAMRLAEEHVGPDSVAAALPASLMAFIHYEHGRLDEAEAMVIDRLPIINATGMLECVLHAYFVLARIASSRMNIQRAYVLLQQAEKLADARGWGRLLAAALVERMRLHLFEDRMTEGIACLHRLDRLAAEYPAPHRCAWSDIKCFAALAHAKLARAEKRFEDAVCILSDLHQEAQFTQRNDIALRLGVPLSLALLGAGRTAEAWTAFAQVLSVAAPAGVYQTILDNGVELGALLSGFQENAQRTGQSRELVPYVNSLIAGWNARYQPKLARAPSIAVAESLSPRERNILELIGQGQSNKEIARDLGIGPETVKSHVKHIFIKLAVEKRAQAVSRAQSLGLVSSH